MQSIVILSCLTALLSLSSANARHFMSEELKQSREKCLTDNSLTLQELRNDTKTGEPSENRLCFHRCMMQAEGLLNDNNEVQEAKLDELIQQEDRMGEEQRAAWIECVKAVGSVPECRDVKKVFDCLPFKKHHHAE